MRNMTICLAAAAFLFMMLFCSVGFAMVNDQLVVQGALVVEEPRSVYIKSATLDSASSGSTATVAHFMPTVLQSEVTLGADANAELRVRIEVKNNTRYAYTFDGIKWDDNMFGNPLIKVTTLEMVKGDELAAGQEKVFYVIFTFENRTVPEDRVKSSILNLSFVLSSEFIPDAAVDNAVARFEEILNDGVDYGKLIDIMEETEGSGRPNTPDGQTYVGNVVGSSSKDREALEELFRTSVNGVVNENFMLNVNGESVYVTMIIKRENADGNNNTEDFTLYLTPVTPTGNYYTKLGLIYLDRQDRRPTLDPVYAIVFRYNDGVWKAITPLFAGAAGATVYGSPSGYDAKNDSFNTNTWKSTTTYWNNESGADIRTLTAAAIANGYTPDE